MDRTFQKFTWTITNFTEVYFYGVQYSEDFILAGYSWRIRIDANDDPDYLSIYLEALASSCENRSSSSSSRLAKFKFSLINQLNTEMTITDESEYHLLFNKSCFENGFKEFIPLDDLLDSRNGFILNDACIIEVEITVIILDELVDFRGIGKIEKAFAPLLEEVCTRHPLLVECQKKKSSRFREWAFTALGGVLHFLKSKKVKDMNEDACNHLQALWEELEAFRFDLSWLEPHFQHALGMKGYVKRGEQVKKMKENVAALEMALEEARRDLIREQEGFEETHLDDDLGYGGQ